MDTLGHSIFYANFAADDIIYPTQARRGFSRSQPYGTIYLHGSDAIPITIHWKINLAALAVLIGAIQASPLILISHQRTVLAQEPTAASESASVAPIISPSPAETQVPAPTEPPRETASPLPESTPNSTSPVQPTPSHTGFIWPATGQITTYFGAYHLGIDIANSGAPDVLAAAAGTVTYSGCEYGGFGCHVRISHPDGFETLYAHLSRLYVSAGEQVTQGRAVGKMGMTGNATGIHLHFAVIAGGAAQNPFSYLP